MKKTITILIAVLSFIQLTAQQGLSQEEVELTRRVNNLDYNENILTEFNFDLNDFIEKNNQTLFDERFEVSNESDVVEMFESIIDARENGLVSQNIWDNFGVGALIKDRIHLDGRINADDFIGELPVNSGHETDIGSEFRGNNSRIGSNTGHSSDIMNPAGNINNSNSSYIGNGLGSNYKNSSNGNTNNNTEENPNESGEYSGQFGNDKGDSYADSTGSNTSVGNSGSHNNSDAVWSVEAHDSSYKHSGSNGYSSFIHQHSSVSNDQGYSSTTDKQSFTGENGTTITRVVVTQTQADGSSKTSSTTTTTDADGNKHTTQTVTETNADGEVTNQETKESNNPPKEGDDSSCERPDDGSYDNYNTPPNDAEKESAIWRAVVNHNLSSGGPRDGKTNNSRTGNMTGSPQNYQNQRGYMEEKTKGGKINKNKVFKQQQVIKKVGQ